MEQLNKKEIRKIINFIEQYCELKEEIPKKGNFKKIELKENFFVIYLDKKPIFFEYNNIFLPNIKLVKEIIKNKILVDMGAIKHLINGADVMAPGIKEYDKNIKKNDPVFILDEKNKSLICIGISLIDFENKPEKGKVIKNLHYVGDKYWKDLI